MLQTALRLRPFSLQQRRRKIQLVTVLLGIVWTAGIAFGLRILFAYETKPGTMGAVPTEWPATSQIERLTDRPTLIMLAHPRCPCTRASMAELAQLMARVQGKVYAYVLFLTPNPIGGDWENTDLRRRAAAIPGVKVLTDIDGVEARRFGAETSGHTILFARDGRLLFSGGITESRGHAGNSVGERAIEAVLNNESPTRTATFVFGCALANHAEIGGKTRCLK